MSGIDFSKKMNFQRHFSPTITAEGKSEIVRQFESDRGRIINSAAIRRLQQKTQVFPLERNAAVRSRLTHSMEVQQVGRHIVKEIVEQLNERGLSDSYNLKDYLIPVESVVEMACLMHDIGNPPFGHFGEAAINKWFNALLAPDFSDEELSKDPCKISSLKLKTGESELNALRQRVRRDLCQFEGNAQAIRLVHTLQKLNLTYAQVACILKYTKPAYWVGDVSQDHAYLMKKTGYYLSEKEFITTLREELGMGKFSRFPLTYIMEAADDISYCIADLEDAVEKEILTVEKLYDLLLKEWGKVEEGDLFYLTVGGAKRKMVEGSNRRGSDDQFFMYLRVFTVANLVPRAAECFIENLPAIFDGNFNQALLEKDPKHAKLLSIFKDVAFNNVFNYSEVEQLELQGDRIISGLLNIYSPLLDIPWEEFVSLVEKNSLRKYPIESRLWHKLSGKQRLAYQDSVEERNQYLADENHDVAYQEVWEFYYRARLIQDYISGMTDLYAYDEYRKLMAVD